MGLGLTAPLIYLCHIFIFGGDSCIRKLHSTSPGLAHPASILRVTFRRPLPFMSCSRAYTKATLRPDIKRAIRIIHAVLWAISLRRECSLEPNINTGLRPTARTSPPLSGLRSHWLIESASPHAAASLTPLAPPPWLRGAQLVPLSGCKIILFSLSFLLFFKFWLSVTYRIAIAVLSSFYVGCLNDIS